MFDLDKEVQRWREHEVRRSSLSPRELDELEDHLRARIDLELELNAGLTPARAFALARDELGTGAALSREFARAGGRRWHRALVFGWVLFAVSFLLPALRFEFNYESVQVLSLTGYEVFRAAVTEGGFRHALCNLAMLLTLPALWRGRVAGGRWLAGGIGLVGLYILATGLSLPRGSGGSSASLQVGYFVWATSFVCAALGLWLRERDWAPRSVERPEVQARGGTTDFGRKPNKYRISVYKEVSQQPTTPKPSGSDHHVHRLHRPSRTRSSSSFAHSFRLKPARRELAPPNRARFDHTHPHRVPPRHRSPR